MVGEEEAEDEASASSTLSAPQAETLESPGLQVQVYLLLLHDEALTCNCVWYREMCLLTLNCRRVLEAMQ